MTILASGLMGTITGSAVANVVTTGAFTIPLMTRTGLSKDFAGAVESAGSTGSQFMPPVMGAQAFIMVQYTGVPYGKIALYSLVPALLYYAGLWINLDLEARRLGLKGLARAELGAWKQTVFDRLHLVTPLVLLVAILAWGYTPMFAAVWSLASLIVVASLRRTTRFTFSQFVDALRRGAETSLPVIAASAVAGIIVLSVAITGLGDRFSVMTIELARGNLPLALFYTMIASLVLGMGLPTIPAYIVQVGLIVPALVKMGLPLVTAHLFVIYFSCLSMITPPVAIAAYAACGISGGNPFRTGFIAAKLAAVGFIVPFAFAFNPGLLLMGDPLNIVQSVVTAFLSVYGLAVAMQGYLLVPCRWWERIFAFAGALLLIAPQSQADIAGFVLLAAVYARQRVLFSRGYPAGTTR
jgi:TRAP transporter 4TM/12TM fusion protein